MKIYLACPYSHANPAVRHERFHMACCVAGDLLSQGHLVHSRLSHSHPIVERSGIGTDWGVWKALDREMIQWADEVWIIPLPGWRESQGVAAETQIAKELGKLVMVMDYRAVEKAVPTR